MRAHSIARLLAPAALSTACAQILGVDDYRVVPDGNAGSPGTDCGACLVRDCSEERAACIGDPGCAGALECELACSRGDVDCASACAGRFVSSGPSYFHVLTCRAERCMSECKLPCNGICSGNELCDTCLAATCEGQAVQVVESSSAIEALICHARSGQLFDPTGICDQTADAGTASLEAWVSCLGGVCAEVCAPGAITPDWRCVGEIDRPLPAPQLTAVDIEVIAVNEIGVPVSGLEIRPCRLGNAICGQSAWIDDPSGIARVHADRNGNSFFDYLEIIDSTSLPLYDNQYVFSYPPTVHDRVGMRASLIAKLSLDGYYQQAGAPGFDRASYGQITVNMRACGLIPGGAGVQFEIGDADASASARVYYFSDGLIPSLTADQTRGPGLGGFIDVRPGLHTITAKRTDTGDVVATAPVLVEAGYVSWVNLSPGPLPSGW